MRVIIDEITSHSRRFEALQQSLRQAFDVVFDSDERESPAIVELDLMKARNVAEDLIRCVCTLRKLHAYRTSVEQRGFTPRQYKMITLNVKLKILAPTVVAFDDSVFDKADAALYMLSCFCRAVREEAVTSEQLRYWQESLDHAVNCSAETNIDGIVVTHGCIDVTDTEEIEGPSSPLAASPVLVPRTLAVKSLSSFVNVGDAISAPPAARPGDSWADLSLENDEFRED
jgi:hypothetical protein